MLHKKRIFLNIYLLLQDESDEDLTKKKKPKTKKAAGTPKEKKPR